MAKDDENLHNRDFEFGRASTMRILMKTADGLLDNFAKERGADRNALETIWRKYGVDSVGYLSEAIGAIVACESPEELNGRLHRLNDWYVSAKNRYSSRPIVEHTSSPGSISDDVDSNGGYSNARKELEDLR